MYDAVANVEKRIGTGSGVVEVVCPLKENWQNEEKTRAVLASYW
jgi:hypothetical protein